MPTTTVTQLPAPQAHAQAPSGDQVLGWKLDAIQRAQLLRRLPPAYPRAVADHVTLKPRVADTAALPRETEGRIVGRTDDGQGVEALAVEIEGSTRRPDGGTYHIAWSLAKGRRPKESSSRAGSPWPPMPLRAEPAHRNKKE